MWSAIEEGYIGQFRIADNLLNGPSFSKCPVVLGPTKRMESVEHARLPEPSYNVVGLRREA